MQITFLLSVLAATVAVQASDVYNQVRHVLCRGSDQKWLTCSLQCVPDKDCCFSTKGACQRQASVWIEKYFQCGQVKKCPDYGVSLQDCVSISLLFCSIRLRADVFSFRMRIAVAYLRKEVVVALVNKWSMSSVSAVFTETPHRYILLVRLFLSLNVWYHGATVPN